MYKMVQNILKNLIFVCEIMLHQIPDIKTTDKTLLLILNSRLITTASLNLIWPPLTVHQVLVLKLIDYLLMPENP